MSDTLLTHARVVFPDSVQDDVSLLISDGIIISINPDSAPGANTVDLAGRLLVPGLIDLHCDALEKEVEPRPGVQFPLGFACVQADRRNALAGITTVYHALSFANHELGVRNNDVAAELARAMHSWNSHALVDNRIHVRYEVTDELAPMLLNGLLQSGEAQMISFMDHTPGQGQFKDVAAFRAFHARNYKKSDAELDAMLANKSAKAEGAYSRMQALSDIAKTNSVAIASHDDDSPERVATMRDLGATISEFPVNQETAQSAKDRNIFTLFGAPNILRGLSQSGSMKAIDAISAGVADCLCGDYSPAALLPGALKASQVAGLSLSEAIAMVTRNPARAAGLSDRGEIAVGMRADLVAVNDSGKVPYAERVWVSGKEVMNTSYPVK